MLGPCSLGKGFTPADSGKSMQSAIAVFYFTCASRLGIAAGHRLLK